MAEFQQLDQNKYIVWTDTGPHFRCAELMHYLFKELAETKIQVCYNLFAECHGKSSRDQHFSSIGFFIKDASNTKKLSTTSDVISAIHEGQKTANLWREKLEKDPITTLAFEYRPNIFKHISNFRTVKNLQTYYNFYTDANFKLFSLIYSDSVEQFEINYKDSTEKVVQDETIKNYMVETAVPAILHDLGQLQRKKERITELFEKKKKTQKKVIYFLYRYLIIGNNRKASLNEFEKAKIRLIYPVRLHFNR